MRSSLLRFWGLAVLVLGVFAGVLLVGYLSFGVRPMELPGVNERTAQASSTSDPWENRRWLDKAARVLRGGEGLGPDDDVEALLALPREAAVRRLMEDSRFGDTILDFNLFFLGFRFNSVDVDGAYDPKVFDFPNAIASARAMAHDGDYLALFDLEGPFFMPPLRTAPVDDPPLHPEDIGLSAEQLRHKAVGELRSALTRLVAVGSKTQPTHVYDFCSAIMGITLKTDKWHERVMRAFDDWEGLVLSRGSAVDGPLDALGGTSWKECYNRKDGTLPNIVLLREAAATALARFERVAAEIASFEPSQYQPRSVADFRPVDLTVFGSARKWISFGYEQGMALPNSSTNANRRRAAYILKRYFCDDLTPVGVEAPKTHAKGAIGEPGCQTCHYKLDPMAGFFRNYGSNFYDFSRDPYLTFDDLAFADRSRYVSGWQSSPQSKRPWEVGFIRSATEEALNSYGESIADLSAIIRKAPEAKQCLMRRLFEYTVAEDQAIDAAWLDGLTKRFEAEAVENSAQAMRNAIVRIVTSDAFLQRDADPRRCYDGIDPKHAAEAPPCRVAFLLDKSCARCHDKVEAKTGRLDLTKWKTTPDGKVHGFPHLDAQSNPLSARESLARLADRVTSNDPALRMPKGRAMSDRDRQELYRWAQEELTRLDDRGRQP